MSKNKIKRKTVFRWVLCSERMPNLVETTMIFRDETGVPFTEEIRWFSKIAPNRIYFEWLEEVTDNFILAVNGTCGKGIHPDAVEDLLSALHGLLNINGAIASGNEPYIKERHEAARAAIEKAKL